MKHYTCQFKITALITAWLWRRRGYQTTIGRVQHLHPDGALEQGYRVTGRAWLE